MKTEMNTLNVSKLKDLTVLLNNNFKGEILYTYSINENNFLDLLKEMGIVFDTDRLRNEFYEGEIVDDTSMILDYITSQNPYFFLEDMAVDFCETNLYQGASEALAEKLGVYCRIELIIYNEIEEEDNYIPEGHIYFQSELEKNFIIQWCNTFGFVFQQKENAIIIKDWSEEQSCYFIFYGKKEAERYSVIDLDALYNGYNSFDISEFIPWIEFIENSTLFEKKEQKHTKITAFIEHVNSTISSTSEIVF